MNEIVFLDYASLAPDDLSKDTLLAVAPDTVFYNHTTSAQLAPRLKCANVVISNKVVLNRSILQSLPQLQLICVAATGTNNIDLNAAQELGIKVCNVRDYATQSVVEHVFSLILNLSRNINSYQKSLQDGAWHASPDFCLIDHSITEISGKTLGIIGYGVLGKAVARTAECFGMEVLVANRPGLEQCSDGRVMLDELLKRSDIVSLHCPLTEHTKNILGTEELRKMKSSAIVINTARGGILDEKALHEALVQGEIAAAGIDVLETEPPGSDSILLKKSLANLIVTPHIAWASQRARQTLLDQLASIISSWQQGNDSINRVV